MTGTAFKHVVDGAVRPVLQGALRLAAGAVRSDLLRLARGERPPLDVATGGTSCAT